MTDEWSLPVRIEELRSLVEAVLSHVEEVNGPVVQIPHDLFWAVHAPAMYDFDGPVDGGKGDLQKPELTIGSLSDAWEFLHRDSGRIAYEAVWLGQILTAIGNTVLG